MTNWPIKRIWELYLNLAELEQGLIHLDQLKRKERGGWRHPSLARPTEKLEKDLLASYHRLFTDLVGSLRGRNDDISSGRLLQKKRAHVSPEDLYAAQEEFNLSDADIEQPLDKSRLAALLAILALWRQKHGTLALAAASPLFLQGRSKALSEAKVPDHHPVDTTSLLSATTLARYSGDLDRLQTGLQDGTARAYGLNWIVQHAGTVGAAAVYLRRLKAAEEYRIGMLAESLLWSAFLQGYREGAVQATRTKLAQLGYETVDQAPDDAKQELPRYEWAGPLDANTCGPCADQFSAPVYAADLNSLPDPQSICEGGLSCRHRWEIVS
jgi:hypothetical protein